MKRNITLLFFLAWASVSGVTLTNAVRTALLTYPPLWWMTSEEKQAFLDEDLYRAAKICERYVPETEALFFYDVTSSLKGSEKMPSESFSRAHHRQKLSYLLYPRRVYWKKENLREPISYVLVYQSRLELPRFEHVVDVSGDTYLLRRKKK